MIKKLYYKYYTWRYNIPHQNQVQGYLQKIQGMLINQKTLGYSTDYASLGDIRAVAIKNEVTTERIRQNLFKFIRMSKRWEKRKVLYDYIVIDAANSKLDDIKCMVEKALVDVLPEDYGFYLKDTKSTSNKQTQYTFEIYVL